MKKVKVLFVCLGNICRSPLAEAIFKDMIKRKNLDKIIEGDSCGTSNYHIGDSPDPRTLTNASRNGIVIDHCGRQLTSEDLQHFDFILAMDSSNLQNILRLPNSYQFKHKIKLMREFDPQGEGEVPDPYYGGEKGFQEVFEILNRSIEGFLNHSAQVKNNSGIFPSFPLLPQGGADLSEGQDQGWLNQTLPAFINTCSVDRDDCSSNTPGFLRNVSKLFSS